jgi:TolB protein
MSKIPRPIFSLVVLSFCFLFLLQACGPTPTPVPTNTVVPTYTVTQTPSPTVELPTQTPFVITATPGIIDETPNSPQGVFILSLKEDGFSHLFAYSPQSLALSRLTADVWDDTTPAVSPDGHSVAYASHRNGYWNLYLVNLVVGSIIQLTDTPEYDGMPSWSPDGAFLAYESYTNGNLEISIHSATDPRQAPLQLTQNPAADSSPAWSPLGRQIAFISDRSGEPEVWIADLDHAGNFINVSHKTKTIKLHPAWSPDGSKLAWAATDLDSGISSIYVWDARNPDSPAQWAGSGDWPVWQDNTKIASRLLSPNQTFFTGYSLTGKVSIPPVLLPGALLGLTYGITDAVFPGPFQVAAQISPTAPFPLGSVPQQGISSGRAALVDLPNVTALYPQLGAAAGISFKALREQVINQTGWDALGNLENAFVPLTTPLDPGMGEDWLFTGRAFTFNPVLIQANWMVVIREDFGPQVYWRIYLRTASQDGSQGIPLSQNPWDFSARITSSVAYENGGQLMNSVPGGYWLDLTTLAAQYGWERLPALSNWRSYYAGTRFTELVFTQGLDWRTAMLQLYPPDVLVTPTIVFPPTRTPTRTPLWYRPPTPTKTPTFRPTSTP